VNVEDSQEKFKFDNTISFFFHNAPPFDQQKQVNDYFHNTQISQAIELPFNNLWLAVIGEGKANEL